MGQWVKGEGKTRGTESGEGRGRKGDRNERWEGRKRDEVGGKEHENCLLLLTVLTPRVGS